MAQPVVDIADYFIALNACDRSQLNEFTYLIVHKPDTDRFFVGV
ncbi:MAG: hypothetical protein RMX63_32360 [Aulosira sp. ZfuCHP01]|nr:hypothetical protein [Aulosira sp. ZfuCHP01]